MSHQLTAEQQAIVEFPKKNLKSHLMISARAGSAKTYTITELTKQLSGAILSLVFNKRNAVELEAKLPSNCVVKTMNSLGHMAWKNALNKNLTLKAGKMYQLAKELAPGWGIDPNDGESFGDWLALAVAARNAGYVPASAPVANVRKDIATPSGESFWKDLCFQIGMEFSQLVQPRIDQFLLAAIKQSYQGIIDFDDQIYMSVLFGGQFSKFPTVIVDETQDLSVFNHIMVEKSLAAGGRLIVVGDPFQSIYAFRGAASNSMDLFAERFEFEKLSLTYSFRCPKVVAAKQRAYVADFQSWRTNAEGELVNWPKAGEKEWELADIPQPSHSKTVAIICRNNAPLFKLAIGLITQRRNVTILGKDIGAGLEKLVRKICHNQVLSQDDFYTAVENWATVEKGKVKDSEAKQATIDDKRACLFAVASSDGVKTSNDVLVVLKDLFADKSSAITLSSGHKSKGLEYDWVMHLDSFRIGAKAKTEEAELQEENLRYVIETRTKHTLVLADLRDCVEFGKED